MKKHFLTGLIILLPIALSILIFIWLVDLLTAPFTSFVENLLLQFEDVWNFNLNKHIFITKVLSRVLVVLFLLLVTFILGFLARKYFFSALLRMTNALFLRIPIVKVIYKLLQDMTQAVFSDGEKPFKETAIVSFPHAEAQAIGLVTGTPPDILRKHAPEVEFTVFVPTSPHPISGFLLLYPKKYAKPIDMSTEDAFKFIISCGVLKTESEKNHETGDTIACKLK